MLPPTEALPLRRRAAEHKDPAMRNLAKLAGLEESREAALALYRRALVKERAASGPAVLALQFA